MSNGSHHFYIAAFLQPPSGLHECFFDRKRCASPGYCPEIIGLLARLLNFTYTILRVRSWDELETSVRNGSANFSMNLLMITYERNLQYNFLFPFNYYHMGFVVKPDSNSMTSSHFPPAEPFQWPVWVCLFALFFILSIPFFLFFIVLFSKRGCSATVESIWHSFAMIMGKFESLDVSQSRFLRRLSFYIFESMTSIGFLLIAAFYSNEIYGTLVARQRSMDFNSTGTLASLIRAGKRQVVMNKDRKSLYETLLETTSIPGYISMRETLNTYPPIRYPWNMTQMKFIDSDPMYAR